MIKGRLDNKTIKRILLGLFVITIITFAFLMIKDTHAYYDYESAWTPIFNSKVGNFAGKGDTSNLDKPTDINVMYYIQSGIDLKKYDIYDTPPANIQTNYVLDEKKSNCIPTDATYTKASGRDFSIANDGTVTINVSEGLPKQVVCRIYYSFKLVDYKEKDGDVKVIMYIETEEGDVVTIRDNKKYIVGDTVPAGYKMTYYECNNPNNITTQLSYSETTGITFVTTGKNICHAYFDK